MDLQSKSGQFKQESRIKSQGRDDADMPTKSRGHVERVIGEMRTLGASPLGLRRWEAKYLPKIIHPDEHLGGVVYGRSHDGSVMLVATDRRVIYLDKKLLFVGEDEITYDIVSGISYGRSLFTAGLKLHTRIGDYEIRTFNQKCAVTFVEYIEARCLENQGGMGSMTNGNGRYRQIKATKH